MRFKTLIGALAIVVGLTGREVGAKKDNVGGYIMVTFGEATKELKQACIADEWCMDIMTVDDVNKMGGIKTREEMGMNTGEKGADCETDQECCDKFPETCGLVGLKKGGE